MRVPERALSTPVEFRPSRIKGVSKRAHQLRACTSICRLKAGRGDDKRGRCRTGTGRVFWEKASCDAGRSTGGSTVCVAGRKWGMEHREGHEVVTRVRILQGGRMHNTEIERNILNNGDWLGRARSLSKTTDSTRISSHVEDVGRRHKAG